MKIDKKLNLVVPILRNDETTLYAHATPIGYEVFKTYYLVLARTWSEFQINRLDPRSAPSVAALVLEDVARQTLRGPNLNWYDGPDGVGGERGLLAEIRRLCQVIVPTATGWQPTMLDLALNDHTVSTEEGQELMSLLAFFTVASHVPASEDRKKMINGMAVMYDSQTTSSDCMAYTASLKTSTPAAPTGGREKASSTTPSAG